MKGKLTDGDRREIRMRRTSSHITSEEREWLALPGRSVTGGLTHRAAMREFDRIRREAWSGGERVTSWCGKWS